MKWKKLGKIFDPSEYTLSNNCFGFAQSPQALVYEEFVRIYFSTRANAENGKFLSHISFVDFDKRFTKVLNVSTERVIELGKLGSFDEHGIFPISPFRANGKILAYTCGWSRRVSVSVETSIGLAISKDDGITFDKVGEGPIMSSSLHEPFLVGDAFVQFYNDTYHMWYIFGTKWADFTSETEPDRVYKIGHATSNDGISWTREGKQIISDRLNLDECQALPTVVHHKSLYHMFFCYRYATDFRKNKNRGYRIGYAYSTDAHNWHRDDDQVGIGVSSDGWDSDMLCYPNVFQCEDKVYMLYNGNEFGRHGFGLAILDD